MVGVRCDAMRWYGMPYVDFGIWFSCLSGMGWDGKCEIGRVRAYTSDPLSGVTSEEN